MLTLSFVGHDPKPTSGALGVALGRHEISGGILGHRLASVIANSIGEPTEARAKKPAALV